MKAGVDTIEHGSVLDDEAIRLMKEHGAYLVADIYDDDFILQHGKEYGYTEENLTKEKMLGQKQRDSFRRAVQAGVKVGFGTDTGSIPFGQNGKQFFYMVKYGLTPMQAIQSATTWAADVMNWSDRIGSLDPRQVCGPDRCHWQSARRHHRPGTRFFRDERRAGRERRD